MSRYTDIQFQTKKLPPVSGYWDEDLVSLEVALKPVESLFNDLSRSIKTAKKHCTFPSSHGLTHDESAAVYLYTMDGGQKSFYRVLNNALRSENRAILRVWFPFLKLFEVAISKLPTFKGSVWRGVSEDVSSQFNRDQVFTWWSISSCSQSVNVIQDFLSTNNNATLFMIEVTNARDISNYSYYPSENEVLLTIGTELRVKADVFQYSGGLKIVHLVQLSNDDDEHLNTQTSAVDEISK
jgi:NAD:arginine ADP-ribosyltransferase